MTVGDFASRLEAQEGLESVLLANNTLVAEGITTLALALRSMGDCVLTELDVSSNYIKDEGVAALACNLPSDLDAGTGIQVLHLVHNAIGQEGALSISQALGRCVSLAAVQIGSLAAAKLLLRLLTSAMCGRSSQAAATGAVP